MKQIDGIVIWRRHLTTEVLDMILIYMVDLDMPMTLTLRS